MENEKKEMTRREFLTWLAAGAALFALPGSGSVARAAAPSWMFADLDFPAIEMPGELLVIPDPPPPIINPPGMVTPAAAPVSQKAPAKALANNYAAAAQQHSQAYASYTPPQSSYGSHQALAVAYQPQDYQRQVQPVQVAAKPQQRIRLSATTRQTAARAPLSAVVQEPPTPMMTAMPAPTGKVTALSRRMWANVAANPGKMRPMGEVKRVTIHHEGSEKPNNDVMPFDVVATLRLIHGQHRKRMGAGDIGYHFIIDRTGMIWQGRDWVYQGAHTSGANVNNLGVMLLGNFEIQRPTQAQLDSLHSLVASLVRKFGLTPSRDIHGHSDFCKTQCPGNNLRSQVDILRRMSV